MSSKAEHKRLSRRDRDTLEAFAQALSDHHDKPLIEKSQAIDAQMTVHLQALSAGKTSNGGSDER